MDGHAHDAGPSWICRDTSARERFLDLHARVMPANTRILIVLAVALIVALPTLPHLLPLGLAAIGMSAYAVVQRRADRFARPELWVFWALLACQAVIVLVIALEGCGATPAVALTAWPLAGLTGRYTGRPLAIGLGATLAMVAVSIVASDPDLVSTDPPPWAAR